MMKWRVLAMILTVSEAEAQSDFAWKLAPLMDKDEQGNVVFSPYSISTALSMAYAGAEGQTAKAFAKTLGIKGPASEQHAACLALETRFRQMVQQTPSEQCSHPFRLSTANRLYAQEGAALKAPFVETLKTSYSSELLLVDFVNAAEPTRLAINSWVEEKTDRKIKELLEPGSVSDTTRMVLVNAIYFQAPWKQPFDEAKTSPEAFVLRDGKSQDVAMMNHARMNVRAAVVKGVEVLEIPFETDGLSMVVLMPKVKAFDAFSKQLNAQTFEALLQRLKPETVALSLPKFEKRVRAKLSGSLSRMGLHEAFSGRANFSGMFEKESIQLSEVVHQAFVQVSEKGTKAAAATSTEIKGGRLMQPRRVMVNQPFVFAIREAQTQTLLFLGQIVNPQ